jgi:hypothetical protein
MTLTFDSDMTDAAGYAEADDARREECERARSELAAMSEAMIEQKGLLNHAQAALLLNVSVKRIGELVRLGKLRRFDFLGRTYVSVREVRERYQQELKAGRPKRGLAQRAVASLKAALKTDAAQAKLGGYAGPYEKAKLKQKRTKK